MTEWQRKDLFAKIIVGVVLLSIIVIALCMCDKPNSSKDSRDGYRCWYCGKVIYYDDTPIHATHKYLDTYTCDYCGKTNKVK